MSSQTDVRQKVAEALGISESEIGDADDLIELGLDSIRIMKIAGGWRKQGHRLNFAQLAAEPTVAAWAARLDETRPETATPPAEDETHVAQQPSAQESVDLESADRADDPFPLAPMQHAFWICLLYTSPSPRDS